MLADAFAFIADVFIGWVPERQPWRAIVAGLYVLGALAAIAFVIWFVASTW